MYKNFLNFIIPSIVGGLLTLITLPIYTRYLSPIEYGTLALAQIFGSFIFSLNTLGLSIGYERDYFEAKRDGKSAELLYSVLTFISASFILCSFIVWIFDDYFSFITNIDKKYSNLLFWSYISIGFSGIKSFFLIYFKNTGDSTSFMKYSLDENILSIILSLLFITQFNLGVFGIVFGQLISTSFILILLVRKIIKLMPFKLSLTIFKKAIFIGLPLTPRIFTGLINKSFDKYIVANFVSISGTGILSISYKVANMVFGFMTALENIFIPKVYDIMFKEDEKKGGVLIGNYLMPFIYVSYGFCLFIVLVIHEFFYFFTSPAFYDGANISILLIMLYSTYFFGKTPQLIFKKKTHIISIISYFSIALIIVINLILVRPYGIFGSAFATLISGLITTLITFFYSNKYYKIIWPTSKILIILTIMFFSSISVIVLSLLKFKYIYIIFFKFIFAGIYILLGFKIKILSYSKCINFYQNFKNKL